MFPVLEPTSPSAPPSTKILCLSAGQCRAKGDSDSTEDFLVPPLDKPLIPVLYTIYNRSPRSPPGLLLQENMKDELTLWKAVTLFPKPPEIKDSSILERHEHGLAHVIEECGKDFPVKQIWIPQIKQYRLERQNAEAAGSTINKERQALSKNFYKESPQGMEELY
jgi:hypothetical protein